MSESRGMMRWLAILRSRPDTEHEMTLNRLAFAIIVIAYLGIATAAGVSRASEIFYSVYPVFVGYIIGAVGIFVHILFRPAAMPARRIIAAFYDMAMISFAAQACGTPSGFFYPLYLWTIFGNGFRFGNLYLVVSMLIALVGFSVVLFLTGFWIANPGFSTALLAGLVLLPTYVSRLIRKLSEAKRQAEEASQAKSRFLASVTHELRTPLNAIIGLSSLFSGVDLDREHAEMMDTIGAAGRTLLGHINSILDLSRMEAGKVLSHKSEFDIYELLVDVRNIVAVKGNGLKVSVHITPRTPQFILGVRQHLEQILLNLAGNAVKFTASGYVVIAVDAVSMGNDKLRLRFEVSDTGIGISPAAQMKIFDSFVQADDSIIDRFGGTGLGLALCKQLVEIQGGQIGVQSSPGEGSTFWFEIDSAGSTQPATQSYTGHLIIVGVDEHLRRLSCDALENTQAVENADQVIDALHELASLHEDEAIAIIDCSHDNSVVNAVVAAKPKVSPVLILRVDAAESGLIPNPERSYYATTMRKDASATDLDTILRIASLVGGRKANPNQSVPYVPASKQFSILIADDNRTNQLVISKILERAGHVVTTVENGAQAVEALHSERFDIALMDLNMPVLNGFDALKQYQDALPGGAAIPIIALTADATSATNSRCLEAGFRACATKPIEPRHLLELVDKIAIQTASKGKSPIVAVQSVTEELSAPAPAPKHKIKPETFGKLEQLGGRPFVEELIKQFIVDGDIMLKGLELAIANKDIAKFEDELHAMRSSAGNIGADSLYYVCLSLRRISSSEFEEKGQEYLQRLTAEFDAAHKELVGYLKKIDAVSDPSSQTSPHRLDTVS